MMTAPEPATRGAMSQSGMMRLKARLSPPARLRGYLEGPDRQVRKILPPVPHIRHADGENFQCQANSS